MESISTRKWWQLALKRQHKWEDKDELLDIVYWLRLILSISIGITWGLIPLTGTIGMITYLGLSAGFVYVYCALFQQIDEEEFGGMWEVLKEGFMTSFASFLINWIIVYTTFNSS